MTSTALSRTGLFHLIVVYIVWSSTYLAIRIAVDPAGGFPPFAMGAIRMVPAALIILAMARLQGDSIRLSSADIFPLMTGGLLLWVFGNGFVVWAEQYVESGFACLIVSSAPLWSTLIELILYQRRPSYRLTASLLLGFLGVSALTVPSFRMGLSTDLWATAVLMLAAVSWGLGSVLQARKPLKLSPQVASGYQHLFASVGFLAMSYMCAEPLPQPSASAWIAWGYLVVFGSVFAFTSYVYTLKLLPLSVAMTYAYVNPVIALMLGWLILDETITVWTIAGAALIITSVAGIFSDKLRSAGKQVRTPTTDRPG